ncbi:MAG: hypothetical protein AB7O24_04770 [Kofleriaceae bacterium]
MAACSGDHHTVADASVITDGSPLDGAVDVPPPVFASGAIASPSAGYVDSIFANASGTRIYFLHSVYAPNDFINGTSNYPQAPFLTGHHRQMGLDYNSDLYYVEWNGDAWSEPVNLGDQINSVGSECCVWLNPEETEIIFYRDTFGLDALGPTGNFIATRATRDAAWSTPVLLPGVYGSDNQGGQVYRHDVHKTTSGDLYLWEHDPNLANGARLLFGNRDGAGWDAPVTIGGSDAASDETQVWVSADERTMVFNRRGADGHTALIRMTRPDAGSAWSDPTSVPLDGFNDANGLAVWGEPSFTSAEANMFYIRFDTSKDPWTADMMYALGTVANEFALPVKLN